jgi:hypothetical protein
VQQRQFADGQQRVVVRAPVALVVHDAAGDVLQQQHEPVGVVEAGGVAAWDPHPHVGAQLPVERHLAAVQPLQHRQVAGRLGQRRELRDQ